MQKKNIFKKKLNQSVLSTTKIIESFFNFFKENFFNKKKKLSTILYTIDQKVFLILSIIFMSTMSYFLLPAFYNKDKIKGNKWLKELKEKHNVNSIDTLFLFEDTESAELYQGTEKPNIAKLRIKSVENYFKK